MLDIFNNDAFSTARLTQAIVDIKHIPSRIREMGLFEVESTDTTSITVEKKGDILSLIAPTPRGGPGVTISKENREMRSLIIPHFEIEDGIMAEEVQNVRAFGLEQQLETVAGKVVNRLRTHANSHDVTEEHARMGAITGVVTYADGSTLDLFAEFGVTPEPEINFDLSNAAAADGLLRKKCVQITRQMSDLLGGLPFQYIHALCADDYFDALLMNKEVRDTYKNTDQATFLRTGYVGPNRSSYGIFEFGGIVFENYRGSVGGTPFIPNGKCQIFPVGVPGLFKTVYAPADYMETVNTLGQPRYAKQYPFKNDKGVHLDSQMNALQYCSRPKVLLKGRMA